MNQVLSKTERKDGTDTVHAVLICTRNRPDDLENTLQSIASQIVSSPLCILIIDASDPEPRARIQAIVSAYSAHKIYYHAFPGSPSAARQRNYGFDHLPPDVAFVSLLDDDVTLKPGYFEHLETALKHRPELGGVGGTVLLPDGSTSPRPKSMWWRRLFLLDDKTPGRVLISGQTSQAQVLDLKAPVPVEWVGGCATFRRPIVDTVRFDDALDGHATDGDLDFSYRVSRIAPLMVDPAAALIHHESPRNRASVARYAEIHLLHRYWFMEKNIRHALRKPAFWWATLGRLLILSLSRNQHATLVRTGILSGLRAIMKRDYPLLRVNNFRA
jgi:GT2 family glycosyltransferase